MTNDHSVRSPSTDGGGMREALESARLDFHNGLDKLDRVIDKIQSSDGGVEVRHAATGNMPGSVPGEEMSSTATSLERSAVQGAAIQPCAGVTPGPSEANSPTKPVAWLREWSFEGEEKIQICDSFERGAYPVYRAGVREAVAWRVKNDFGHWYITQDKALADTYRDIEKLNVEPLYGSPVDAGMREVLDEHVEHLRNAVYFCTTLPELEKHCTTVADALASLELPDTEMQFADSAGLKSRTAQSEQGGCGDDLTPQGATASINSEANSTAAPVTIDVTGLPESMVADIRAHIRGAVVEGDTYEYELGSGWRCFHCGEMFRTPGGAELHFGKPKSTPACVAERGWRYEIQHGPDGETDYAWVYDDKNNMVCTAKTSHAIAIVGRADIAAAPVDAGVREALVAFVKAYGSQESSTKGLDDALVRAKAALSTALREVTGWLIERGDPPEYATLTADYDEHWTTDASDAIRFARQIDAQAYSDHIGWTSPPVRVTEHMWCEPRAALSSQPVVGVDQGEIQTTKPESQQNI